MQLKKKTERERTRNADEEYQSTTNKGRSLKLKEINNKLQTKENQRKEETHEKGKRRT